MTKEAFSPDSNPYKGGGRAGVYVLSSSSIIINYDVHMFVAIMNMYADNEYPSAVFDLFHAGKVVYLDVAT